MHEKEIEKLQAKKEKVERQLAQEQHKIQRLKNRAAYYEKGDCRKRAHRLITRGAAIESVAPQTNARTPSCGRKSRKLNTNLNRKSGGTYEREQRI